MMDRYNVRTDLALEQRERFVSDQIEIPGVAVEETYDDMCEVRVTTVRIETENGAAVMGKPVGNYITLEAPKMAEADESYHREISGKLMEVLEGCLPEKEDGQSILIIGLGNRNVTPDALGPLVVEHLDITRHLVKEYGKYEILGRTRDDAAGEAYDKVARAIGLGYPGGPKIDRIAKEGNPDAIQFPKAKVNDAEYDFSFSGLKSAVLNYINGCKMKGETFDPADLAASFQKAVVEVLVGNSMRAVEKLGMKKFAIAGGVASNSALREAMEEACEKRGMKFYRPSPIYCTDNAAMIGAAAYYEYLAGTRSGWDLNAVPNLKLGER